MRALRWATLNEDDEGGVGKELAAPAGKKAGGSVALLEKGKSKGSKRQKGKYKGKVRIHTTYFNHRL